MGSCFSRQFFFGGPANDTVKFAGHGSAPPVGIGFQNDLCSICGGDPEGKIHMLLDYTDRPGSVADPWYTDDFDATWRDAMEGCTGLLKSLTQR